MDECIFISNKSTLYPTIELSNKDCIIRQVTEQYSIDNALLQQFTDATEVFLDIETTGLNPFYEKVILIGLQIYGTYYILDARTLRKEYISTMLNAAFSNAVVVAHGAAFDLKMLLYHYKCYYEDSTFFCTMLANKILFNGWRTVTHNYKDVVQLHLSQTVAKEVRNTFIGMPDDVDVTTDQLVYLINDIKYLPFLKTALESRLQNLRLENTVTLEMRFIVPKIEMELRGMGLDETKWKEITEKNLQKLTATDGNIHRILHEWLFEYHPKDFSEHVLRKLKLNNFQYDLFNDTPITMQLIREINLGSPKQIQTILQTMGVIMASTKEEFLEQFLRDNPTAGENAPEKFAYLFIKELINRREVAKQLSTYGEGFLDARNKVTKRIHTEFSQVDTDTGRLSSHSYESDIPGINEGTNLQNIPREEMYRSCFIPTPGYWMVTNDFSGQEICIAAKQSRDPMLIASINEGLDLHSTLATDSYRIITGDRNFLITKHQNKELRTKHKNVLFAYFYAAGIPRIMDQLNIAKPVATKVYKKLASNLGYLTKYQESIKRDVAQNYIIRDHSYTNRIKYFQDYLLRRKSLEKIQKEACNFPIQSTGASMIKEAIIEIRAYFLHYRLDAFIISTVHDEIIYEINRNYGMERAKEIAEEVRQIMKDVGKHYLEDIPIDIEYAIAECWQK